MVVVYRTFALRAPKQLTWRLLYSQFGVDPAQASDKRTVDAFRTDCLRELKKSKLAWPGLDYTTAPGVLILHPSTPTIAPSSDPPRLAEQIRGFCHRKGEMKSKISIWDCRRAIDIKGGLPLTMRGDLFDVDRPSAASVARWPPVKLLVTQLEVKQGQWIAGNIVFTRSGQEHLTKLARDIIADNDRLYAAHISDLDGED